MADASDNQVMSQNFAYVIQARNDDAVISLPCLTVCLPPGYRFLLHDLAFLLNLEHVH